MWLSRRFPDLAHFSHHVHEQASSVNHDKDAINVQQARQLSSQPTSEKEKKK
jgi:hypothetical protein